jgi:D-alanyl-D-alanine carboxypeptidase
MTKASIPGAIVGIWGPAGYYVRAFGVADKATRAPMSTDMCSRIGSVTKTFTVTAMLQLIDQGKLKLDDPISKYIPGVPVGDQITLRNLAQMQSGLLTFDDVAEFANSYLADPHQSFTPAQLVGYALDKPLQFPPGTQYQYSNTNTVLLGLVVEKQSGQSLPNYIRDHILAPLKMTHTSFPTTAAFPDPHPQGYTAPQGWGCTPPTGTHPGPGAQAT